MIALLDREYTPARAVEYQQVDVQERAIVNVWSYQRRKSLERLNSGHPLSQRDPPLFELSQRDPPLFEDDRPKLFPLGRGEDMLHTEGR